MVTSISTGSILSPKRAIAKRMSSTSIPSKFWIWIQWSEGERMSIEGKLLQAGWRVVVMAAAQAQALQEGRVLWHVAEGEPLPFDARFEHVRQVTTLALRLGRV